MTQVFRVSKTGYDVLTTTDKRNLVFDMGNNVYKILMTGTINISYTAHFDQEVFASGSVTHGLGYVPIAFVFNTDDGVQIPFSHAGNGTYFGISYKITNSVLTVVIDDYSNDGPMNFSFKYQIMADKIY